MRERGLLDIQRFDHPLKPYLLEFENYLCIWAMLELDDGVRKKNSDPAYAKELDSRKQGNADRVASGERWVYNVPVFIGRKPE